jgi:hypothetical protein
MIRNLINLTLDNKFFIRKKTFLFKIENKVIQKYWHLYRKNCSKFYS